MTLPKKLGLGPRPRRGDPAETAHRLLLAAADELNLVGYYATDSNRIAERAGYSPGTFYKHYRDKRAVFLAVYAWWVQSVWSDVDAAFAAEQEDPHARALRIVESLVATHAKWVGFRRDLKHLTATDDEVKRVFLAGRKKQLDALVALASAEPAASRADAALLLFTLERTADAIAEGEAAGLGVDVPSLVTALAARIVRWGKESKGPERPATVRGTRRR